uniref:Uncharacterized protein n=1 Tax=Arundo donax TaxID=35708 RepID=A0A0A9HPU8_ARUDO
MCALQSSFLQKITNSPDLRSQCHAHFRSPDLAYMHESTHLQCSALHTTCLLALHYVRYSLSMSGYARSNLHLTSSYKTCDLFMKPEHNDTGGISTEAFKTENLMQFEDNQRLRVTGDLFIKPEQNDTGGISTEAFKMENLTQYEDNKRPRVTGDVIIKPEQTDTSGITREAIKMENCTQSEDVSSCDTNRCLIIWKPSEHDIA